MSAGSIPCLTSMSLVAIARPISRTTIPTSYGAKSNFGVALLNIFFAECGKSNCKSTHDGGVVGRVSELFTISTWSSHVVHCI